MCLVLWKSTTGFIYQLKIYVLTAYRVLEVALDTGNSARN